MYKKVWKTLKLCTICNRVLYRILDYDLEKDKINTKLKCLAKGCGHETK